MPTTQLARTAERAVRVCAVVVLATAALEALTLGWAVSYLTRKPKEQ